MVTVSVELPDDVFIVVRKPPNGLARALRFAAALRWYELGLMWRAHIVEVLVRKLE